jgi:hypothetical protein
MPLEKDQSEKNYRQRGPNENSAYSILGYQFRQLNKDQGD